MDSVPPFEPTRNAAGTAPGLYSEHMLTDLLALHDSMIAQLRLEWRERGGAGDLIPGMIVQHEKSAAMLRAHLLGAATAREVYPVVPVTFPPIALPEKPSTKNPG